MRIVLIGAVRSTLQTLQGLLRNEMDVVGVLGLEKPRRGEVVSGWTDLEPLCQEKGVPFQAFRKINSAEVKATLTNWRPDLIFVVGLSQLINDDLIRIAPHGGVGFHPTPLPQGRGRAPLAWLTLEGTQASATFFQLEDTPDSGPVFVQELVPIPANSYADDVSSLIYDAIDRALDQWLPRLKNGDLSATPQDPAQASWLGKRTPDDGWIDWNQPATAIHALIRASATPHPGAFSFLRSSSSLPKLLIWRATLSNEPFKGTTGHILDVSPEKGALVQCGNGLLRIQHYEFADAPNQRPLRTGDHLGLSHEIEIIQLKAMIQDLSQRVETLEKGK